MTLLALLEREKEKLLSGLLLNQTPERAKQVIAEELDRLLLMYNENCDLSEKREAAAHMLQTAKLSTALVDTIGETTVWTEVSKKEDGQTKTSLFSRVLILAGVVLLCVSCLLGILANTAELHASDVLLTILLAVLAAFCFWFSGRKMAPARAAAGSYTQKVEIHIDPQKIYLSLRNLMLGIDQCLDQIQPAAMTSTEEGTIAGMDMAELELFAGLLEAFNSQDGQYALDRIADVRYYLHKQGVELRDYDGSNRNMFDFLPSRNRRTLRPAMILDSQVIKRGLAAGDQ